MSHRIEFCPEALGDLTGLDDYIALRDGVERAIGRIDDYCRNRSASPDRGIRRDDLRPADLRLGAFLRLNERSTAFIPAIRPRLSADAQVFQMTGASARALSSVRTCMASAAGQSSTR